MIVENEMIVIRWCASYSLRDSSRNEKQVEEDGTLYCNPITVMWESITYNLVSQLDISHFCRELLRPTKLKLFTHW